MINYRDGEWHDWTGGDPLNPPVYSSDLVEYILKNGDTNTLWAGHLEFDWIGDEEGTDIVKFRVVNDYEM